MFQQKRYLNKQKLKIDLSFFLSIIILLIKMHHWFSNLTYGFWSEAYCWGVWRSQSLTFSFCGSGWKVTCFPSVDCWGCSCNSAGRSCWSFKHVKCSVTLNSLPLRDAGFWKAESKQIMNLARKLTLSSFLISLPLHGSSYRISFKNHLKLLQSNKLYNV